ncbi:MAG: tetratricopeptide repeat protein [Sporocytophaga sp.]|uniref:tetratricopeptide repeat protein n=1 Tax=Sporocytophaga sp. TaxID=2231183 RepID=UPI001B100CDF|nr:tetratricopeptide repeat protein [Sporocytophaga sp.]MBO9699022.1 tetratricopeptide repeat protein [Sporocytophaga sp.]
MKKIIIPVVVIIFGAVGALAYKSLRIEKIPSLLDRPVADSDVNEWKHIKRRVDELHSKIRKNSEDNTSRLLLAEIYANEGNISGKHFYYYSAVLDLLNYIIENSAEADSIRTEARLNKASLLLSLNQFEQAKDICNELSEEGHKSQRLSEINFDAFIGIGDYTNAQKVVDQMKASGFDLKVLTRIAMLDEIKGDLTKAKSELKKGLDSGSTNKDLTWRAQYKLGTLYEKEADLAKAEEIYKSILTDNSGYPFAKAGIARIKAANNDYEGAVTMLEAAYKSNAVMVFKQDIALIYKNTGRINDAKKEVQDIVNSIEEGEKAGCNYDLVRARLYSEILEDFDLALIYAERAKERWPENVDLNKVLSLIFYKLGEYEDAGYYLNKATSVQPNEPSLMCLSGLLKYKRGNSKEGIDMIKKAMHQLHYQHSILTVEANDLIAKNDLSISLK